MTFYRGHPERGEGPELKTDASLSMTIYRGHPERSEGSELKTDASLRSA